MNPVSLKPNPLEILSRSQRVGRDLSASKWVIAARLIPIFAASCVADMPCLRRASFKSNTTFLSTGSVWLGPGTHLK